MKKISFIIYYEEERALQECIYYIKRLQAPVGFEIDFFCVKNAESMEAVRKAAAENGCTEYQVYLDQNVLIINNFFLYEVLSRLQKETEPVVLGVWGNAVDKSNRGRLLLWTETGIEEAACVCGRADTEAADISEILTVTRYDFADTEARKRIPYQAYSWCIYDCRNDKGAEIEREYRYCLLRAEIFRDAESRNSIGGLLRDGRLKLEQQVQRAENQAFAKTIMGYYWEDYYSSARKWKKYLPANGRISLQKNENEEMNIVMSFSHGYVEYARVMLQSLYINNSMVNICVHILQCDLGEEDKCLLRKQAESFGQRAVFYDFDRKRLPEEIRTTDEWSIEAYFRLFMTELLPKRIERILYLDVDIIIHKPIYDFYYMDMQEYDIVGCRDFSRILQDNFSDKRRELFAEILEEEQFVYINSGVMLVNLEKLREQDCIAAYQKIIAERQQELLAPDQDIINLVHWKRVGLVDEYRYDFFNACFSGLRAEEVRQEVSIIHYAGPKPWMPIDTNIHAHKIWHEYAGLL